MRNINSLYYIHFLQNVLDLYRYIESIVAFWFEAFAQVILQETHQEMR